MQLHTFFGRQPLKSAPQSRRKNNTKIRAVSSYFYPMKKLFTLVAFTLFAVGTFAQKAYFQQKVAYTIQVKLHDGDHSISGFESFVYTNNSPDVLDKLYIHLWPNAYKNNRTALARQLLNKGESGLYYAEEKDLGWIDSLDFKVDGVPVAFSYLNTDTPDVAILKLPKALNPGASITVTTPFHVKLPASFSRMGHIKQSYQITQWYPKPAVYDLKGWHPIPYLNQGEFYSEYGSYDVSITVPSNYVVGASGNLQTVSEMNWLDSLAKSNENRISATPISKGKKAGPKIKAQTKGAASEPDSTKPSTPSSSTWKTIRYTLENVHDFAWFADKDYLVLKSEVKLPYSGRTVKTWLMYSPENKGVWDKGKPFIDSSIYYYSLWVGDYPYDVCTAVDGALSAGGGMEYPTITIISQSGTPKMLDLVIAHEVGHNWFYGILGSNEREYTWMDEGLNSYFEDRYLTQRYGKGEGSMLPPSVGQIFGMGERDAESWAYFWAAGRGEDQSLGLPAYAFTDMNYGLLCYKKTATTLRYLADYLGQELYDSAMHQYFTDWKFKHPQPEDILASFEKTTGKDLKWFFNDIIGSAKIMDYSIKSVHVDDAGNVEVTIKNTGEIASPFPLVAQDDEGGTKEQWVDGFTGTKTIRMNNVRAYDVVSIDPEMKTMDLYQSRNKASIHGAFKAMRTPTLSFGTGVQQPGKSRVYWMPAIGSNHNDGFMAGAIIHNLGVPTRHWEYVLMPLYGFKSDKLAGSARVFYKINPLNGGVKHIRLGVTARQYSLSNNNIPIQYQNIVPELKMEFGKRGGAFTPKSRILTIKAYFNTVGSYTKDSVTGEFAHGTPMKLDPIFRVNYEYRNAKKINPNGYVVDLQANQNFARLGITLNQKISYQRPGKGIDIRLFGGYMYEFTSFIGGNPYGFRSLGYSAADDYLLEQVNPGRNQLRKFWSRQRYFNDGGIRAAIPFNQNTPFSVADKWLGAANLTFDIPFKLPIAVYADAVTYNGIGAGFVKEPNAKLLYAAGLEFAIKNNQGKKIFQLCLPLVMSKEISFYQKMEYSKFKQQFVFNVNFELMDLLNKLR